MNPLQLKLHLVEKKYINDINDNLKEGEKYQQVAVLESEVQVDSYIRENNQCGFTKAQKNLVNCTLQCSNPEDHKMVAAYFKCSCLQVDCNLR
jgi:hypothetical protein